VRNNYAGLDINRQYHNSDLPEVRAQKSILGEQRFDLHLTLHEDVDAPGFYIYELSRFKRSIAARVIRNVSKIVPIDPRGIIEGRRARHGLIRRTFPPRGMKQWPEAIYMFAQHADRTMTTETPGLFEFEERVTAQLIALRTACEGISGSVR